MISDEDYFWWEYQCVIITSPDILGSDKYTPATGGVLRADIELIDGDELYVFMSENLLGRDYDGYDRFKDYILSLKYEHSYVVVIANIGKFTMNGFRRLVNTFQPISLNLRSRPEYPMVMQIILSMEA